MILLLVVALAIVAWFIISLKMHKASLDAADEFAQRHGWQARRQLGTRYLVKDVWKMQFYPMKAWVNLKVSTPSVASRIKKVGVSKTMPPYMIIDITSQDPRERQRLQSWQELIEDHHIHIRLGKYRTTYTTLLPMKTSRENIENAFEAIRKIHEEASG